MSKKLFVFVIAIVLVAAITGTCFALYSVNATSKTVSISAGYQVVNLGIYNEDFDATDLTAHKQSTITLSGFNPTNTSQTIDVVLAITNPTLADGVHGVFKLALSGDLSEDLNVTVNTLDAVGGNVTGAITTAATSVAGYDVALSSTPVFVRLTFALKDAAIADFSTAAEETASLTLSWTVAEGSVFTYSNTAYYVVGTVNGSEEQWHPCADSYRLTAEGVSGNNVQQLLNVPLKAGDEFKVVWNYYGENNETSQWYGLSNGGNVVVSEDGIYNIYLYNNNGYFVSIDKQ